MHRSSPVRGHRPAASPVFASRFTAAALALLLASLLAACASPPPPPTVLTPAQPATSGEILGRNDRFVIYQPRPNETLRSIAAQFLGAADRDWVIGDFNGLSSPLPGKPLVVPLQPNPLGVQDDRYQTVPILCYHRFGGAANKMAVSPANFAAQLEWLARNDYRVIRLSQLTGFLQGREALPKRSVVITIDDGYESVHRVALPLLRKYGFPATLFVYSDFIGAGDALSWNQLAELKASGLVDIQAHSKSHRNMIERLAGETDERYRQSLDAEARVPREVLERRLPVQVRQFAYPYGDANEAVLETLTRLQYQLAVTVHPGGNPFFAAPLMLRRTMIFGDHDIDDFKAKLQISRGIAAP
jgi:peptidoglycan/xylan/chitin deacetylase (PgdA/CDA1 family)